MKSKDEKKSNKFEIEYNKMMKGFEGHNILFSQTPQWTRPSDFIVKFSLYQETPNSITSTETSVNLGI